MCAIDDCDPWTFHNQTRPVARTPHPCGECHRIIRPGERYLHGSGMVSAQWYSYRLCAHCDAAGVLMSEMCGGWPLGGLLDELVEHWHEGYRTVPFGRLIARMRHRWHEGADPIPDGSRDLARALMAA